MGRIKQGRGEGKGEGYLGEEQVTEQERLLAALEYQEAQRPALMNPNLMRQGQRMNLPARQAPGPMAEFVTQAMSLDPQPDQGLGTMGAEMGLSLVPGVGQAMGLRDVERGRRANDPVMMGLGAASLIPVGKMISALRGGKQMGPVSELDVYHGSPHRFPPTAKNPLGEFDATKIGTGEGDQAYGYGHYLAENFAVARDYQKNLGGGWRTAFNDELATNLPQPAPLAASRISKHNGNIKAAIADLRSSDMLPYKQAGDWLEKQHSAGAVQTKEIGSLYKVDLPDEQIAKMLDWDKPLSQQPTALKPLLKDIENAGAFAAEKIKVLAQQPGLADWAKRDLMNDAAQIATSKSPQHVSGVLKRMQLDYGISPDSGPFKNVANDFLGFVKGMQAVPNMDTGGGAISYLQARYGQEAASKMLRDAGIPGIKYLDQGSRAAPSSAQFVKADVVGAADDLTALAKSFGLDAEVRHSGSNAGKSSYITVFDPMTNRYIKSSFRISDHGTGPLRYQDHINISSPADLAAQKNDLFEWVKRNRTEKGVDTTDLRAPSQGTSNFVVFPGGEKMLNILERQ